MSAGQQLDSVRRHAVAECLRQAQLAFAVDQAILAVYGGGAPADEVAPVVQGYFAALQAANRDLIAGLVALSKNANIELTSTGDDKDA